MTRDEIIEAVQTYCADIAERIAVAEGDDEWTLDDAQVVAELINHDEDPWDLFRFMDEKTGDWRVGYRTKDGREWFHILRQMRNTVGSGLFEYLGKPPKLGLDDNGVFHAMQSNRNGKGGSPDWLRLIHACNGVEPKMFGQPEIKAGHIMVEVYPTADVIFVGEATTRVVGKTNKATGIIRAAAQSLGF